MSLFSFGGKLLKSGSSAAGSQECCCDGGDDSGGGPGGPPPSGPDCPCQRFADCTVTISYDGLTVEDLHKNLVQINWFKSGGVFSWFQFGFTLFASIDRILSINARANCSLVPAQIVGTCGIPNSSAFYHLALDYGTGFTKNAAVSFYRYNVDADESQPCPSTVAGKTITVSEIWRMPTASFDAAQCGKSCQELKASRLNGQPSSYRPNLSHTWSNIVWAPYQDSPNVPGDDPLRGQYISPVEDENWPCALDFYDEQRPQISVVCPP